MANSAPQLVVIDPAVRIAEVDCFNRIALASRLPATYHLPAMAGLDSLARVTKAAGIVILGSASSVYDNLPWQRPLEAWVREKLEAGVPTLGLCYGHQMIAHLYGGKVGFLHDDKRKRTGFKAVRLAEGFWGKKAEGRLYLSHRETVTACPASMAVVGASDECAVEAMAHKKLPVWTLQAHPEATPDFVKNRGEVAPGEAEFGFGWGLVDAFVRFAAEKS